MQWMVVGIESDGFVVGTDDGMIDDGFEYGVGLQL